MWLTRRRKGQTGQRMHPKRPLNCVLDDEKQIPREVRQSIPETRVIVCRDMEMRNNTARVKFGICEAWCADRVPSKG